VSYTIGIDARKLHDFGIGTYVRNLIYALADLDHENRYVVFSRSPAAGTPLADLPENFQVVAERSPVYSLREMVALSWRLFRLKLDLYHATHYVLPAVVPCRVVVTIHDIIHLLYPEFLPSRLAFFYAQRMIRRGLTRGDRIITVSQNTKADLMEYFEVDGTKIDVVYNGVDDVFRRHLPPDELERALKSLEITRPYVLFVGNPAKKHKNLDNVVKAYARARQIQPFDAPLVCVGDRTSAGFKFLQRAAQLGIGDRVLLLGHVAPEALPAIYQGASLFLYPTLYEGFGLPVAEAMASGVPVITSNTSSLKEIAEGYSHLVDPLNVEGMAKAIAQCMADEDHRKALAKLGLRRAQDFRWPRTAERTLTIYRTAIEGPPLASTASTAPAAPAAQKAARTTGAVAVGGVEVGKAGGEGGG
jgi:glycosyltransferase involved in cell wall biosynthesis